jgi:hypothetical protein
MLFLIFTLAFLAGLVVFGVLGPFRQRREAKKGRPVAQNTSPEGPASYTPEFGVVRSNRCPIPDGLGETLTPLPSRRLSFWARGFLLVAWFAVLASGAAAFAGASAGPVVVCLMVAVFGTYLVAAWRHSEWQMASTVVRAHEGVIAVRYSRNTGYQGFPVGPWWMVFTGEHIRDLGVELRPMVFGYWLPVAPWLTVSFRLEARRSESLLGSELSEIYLGRPENWSPETWAELSAILATAVASGGGVVQRRAASMLGVEPSADHAPVAGVNTPGWYPVLPLVGGFRWWDGSGWDKS